MPSSEERLIAGPNYADSSPLREGLIRVLDWLKVPRRAGVGIWNAIGEERTTPAAEMERVLTGTESAPGLKRPSRNQQALTNLVTLTGMQDSRPLEVIGRMGRSLVRAAVPDLSSPEGALAMAGPVGGVKAAAGVSDEAAAWAAANWRRMQEVAKRTAYRYGGEAKGVNPEDLESTLAVELLEGVRAGKVDPNAWEGVAWDVARKRAQEALREGKRMVGLEAEAVGEEGEVAVPLADLASQAAAARQPAGISPGSQAYEVYQADLANPGGLPASALFPERTAGLGRIAPSAVREAPRVTPTVEQAEVAAPVQQRVADGLWEGKSAAAIGRELGLAERTSQRRVAEGVGEQAPADALKDLRKVVKKNKTVYEGFRAAAASIPGAEGHALKKYFFQGQPIIEIRRVTKLEPEQLLEVAKRVFGGLPK